MTMHISPQRYLEASQQLTSALAARRGAFELLHYDAAFEAAADAAISIWFSGEASQWAAVAPAALRVLAERHVQMMMHATSWIADTDSEPISDFLTLPDEFVETLSGFPSSVLDRLLIRVMLSGYQLREPPVQFWSYQRLLWAVPGSPLQ